MARFAADLDKLTQYGTNLKGGALGKALIDVAIADYYFMQSGFTKDFFNAITGGIGFDLADIGAGWASNKTVAQLDNAIISQYLNGDQTARSFLSQDNYWSIQSGANALNATGTGANNDAMIGGATNDTLDGGAGNDFLYGGDGIDTLTGGAGDDQLISGAADDILDGGAGHDTYTLEGRDTIRDSDGQGILKDKAGNLIAGVIEKRADGTYAYLSNPSISVTLDTNLTLTFADGTVAVIENFQSGNLGLQLADTATLATTLTLTGDIIPTDINPALAGIQANCDALINPIGTAGAYADQLYGSAGNDHILSGELGDDVAGLGGDDWIEGGIGNDYILGGIGLDLIEGGQGADILAGGDGSDQIYGDVKIDSATAISNGNMDMATGLQGDWLTGGSGGDTLIAGAFNDVLAGGGGNDILIAGAGDDYILGDSDYTATSILEVDPSYTDVATNVKWYHSSPQTFDWTVTQQADGTTLFNPVTDATNPTDDGNDIIYAGAGNDYVWAGAGSDVVYGEAGTDTINGEAGNDILMGGAGDDVIFGDGNTTNTGDDYLDGGIGNDTLWGGNGNDVLVGGTGNDKLNGDVGANYLDGGDGADILNSGGPGSTLIGGAGDDDLAAIGGGNYLDGGDGNDAVYADGGNNELFGGAGNDTFHAAGGNNYLDGEDGTNILQAVDGNNTLLSGTGNDNLSSSGGMSSINGGAGNDTLVANMGNNTLTGGLGDDTLSATGGGNTLDGGDGADSLVAAGGNSTLTGGAGDDNLSVYGDNNTLDGGSGNDALWGDTGRDTLSGGAGDDTLQGGDGNDVYVYNIGDGVDHIVDSSRNGQINTLRFGNGISTTNIVLRLGSLMLDLGNGDAIHIDNFDPNNAADSSSIQSFEFADGTVFTAQQLVTTLGFDLAGTTGNDILTGTNVDDRISGGAGNDTLSGGTGNDTYNYNAGDGADSIVDSGQHTSASGIIVHDINTLRLGAGISAAQITSSTDSATGQVILNLGAGDSIKVGAASDLAIQTILLADGTRIGIADVLFHFQLKKPIIMITYNDRGDIWQDWRVGISF